MTRLTVAIRVRPLSERELSCKSVSIVSVEDGKTVAVTNTKVPEQNAGDSRERVRRFNFDYCFNYQSSQEDVYRKIGEEIVGGVRTRVHSCILAYGQSASGKTHTMIGDAPANEGVVPRLCQRIFNYLKEAAIGSELENINATVSFLEIYNEKVRDLLNHEAGNVLLKVREHPKTGPYVQGLSEQTVSDSNALLSLLHAGNANRTIGATNANPRSSRSHSVFTITCLGGLKLKFVDLAGSERAGSHTTSRFREGANINRSLVALRNVISALADWSKLSKLKTRFVPYRDSVLTWLLKDTLGGNSKTILISTVSPASTCYNETVNTLRFGQRAKQIAVQPLLNEDPKEKTIRELRAEIAKLRELLEHVHKPFSSSYEECVNTEYAKNESSDSDSGVSADVNLNVPIQIQNGADHIIAIEKLYPLMEVTAKMADPTKSASRPLQRTFSVDHQAESQPEPRYSSHEVLPVTNNDKIKKSATSSNPLRKLSTDKSNLSLKSVALRKMDTKTKIESKPKVDSHRKAQPKPRSQIVAAVTQRLYNKVKKKEVATDTLDLSNPLHDMSITSKARFRLQELTQKALKAHRRRNAETQTSLFPVLRFKEISTDVDDLRLLSEEVANVDIATDAIETIDASTNCTFIDTLQPDEHFERKPTIILTRSCGTLTENLTPNQPSSPSSHVAEEKPLSFTKYLMHQNQAPTFEIVNPATANPIYTSSVNINVNHNYSQNKAATTSGKSELDLQLANETLSDDSLDGLEEGEQGNQRNVCFPTPDLISNHNSEPHACMPPPNNTLNSNTSPTTHATNMCYAINSSVEDCALGLLPPETPDNHANFCIAVANCSMESPRRVIAQKSIETQYAPQMCMRDDFDDDYDIFYKAPPQKYRSNIAHDHLHDPIQPNEPVILKSIMKCNDVMSDDYDSESLHVFDNIPDSLNYYYEKGRKTVRFDSPSSSRCSHSHQNQHQDDQMLEVLAGFMKEVTSLVTNLTKVASRLDLQDTEQSYDMQVVVNDIQGLNHFKCNQCCHNSHNHLTESTQTLPISTSDCSTGTEMEFEELPVNKFEALLESSCKRLESTIQRSMANNIHERRDIFSRNATPQMFAHAPDWNYRNAPEDSSLESQPTFSDYGSLPRRRNRTLFSSPSNYLRQLTNMRREIVRTSRDELLQEADIHL